MPFEITPAAPVGLTAGGTITGNLIITGTLNTQGAVTFDVAQTTTGLFSAEGGILIDETGTEVFLVRQEADAQDVFAIDTTNQVVTVTGSLTISTPLAVAQGGIGVGTLADGGILLGSGTSAITALAVATAGQMLIGSTTGDPVMGTLAGTANEVAVTTGDGTLAVGLATNVTVAGTLTSTGNADFQGTVIVDVTNAEALLVRKNSDGGDIFTVNTSTGIITHGASPADSALFQIKQAFTSLGDGTASEILRVDAALTGADGDTGSLAQVRLAGSINTQTAAETVLFASTLHLVEPNITENGSTVVNEASTLHIENAPTEGAGNYALLVSAGLVRCEGGFTMTGQRVQVNGNHTHGSSAAGTWAQTSLTGSYTSSGAAAHAVKHAVDGTMTGASGDTTILAGGWFNASLTAQAVAETIVDSAQLVLEEPTITASTATITNAATLIVQDAPTEGTVNAAVLVKAGESVFAGGSAVANATEGFIGRLVRKTAHETHTLAAATSSVTTTLSIPSGARLIGASFNVNTAVTNDGDNTWLAAFSGGSTTNVAPAASAAAQNTKVNTQIVDELASATTEITFTPQSGSFTAGVIEVVVYYEVLTSLANV